MLRPSKATTIIKAEIDNGLVEVVHCQDMIEYWVYVSNNSSVIDGATGRVTESHVSFKDNTERTLKCVVVCSNEVNESGNYKHIIKDCKNHILITGFIFSDIDYPDLTDYLGKTERHL